MKFLGAARVRIASAFAIIAVAGLLAGLSSTLATSAAPAVTQSARPQSGDLKAWREFMKQVPMPETGCFEARYPDSGWQEVPCIIPPPLPYPPARGPRSDTVGNGTDFSAEVSRRITEAEGSFDSVAGVTRESGTTGGKNAFSLQLNTSFFTTLACALAADPANCRGWEQFIYSNINSRSVFIQYWLLDFAAPCPPGAWIPYQSDCFMNNAGAAVPVQPITQLGELRLTGRARSGDLDRVILSTGTKLYSSSNGDTILNLGLAWTTAEFNIVGDCCGSQANFNRGSTVVVRTSAKERKTEVVPSCLDQGFTGETNNLTVVESAAPSQGSLPAIVFTESNASGAAAGKRCHRVAAGSTSP